LVQYSDFLGRGWAFPVQTQNGQVLLAANEKDIREAILLILSTGLGERVMRPTFGSRLNELVFAANNSSTVSLAMHYTREALDTWEPRIEVGEIIVTPGGDDNNRLDIDIHYTIRASNVPENLVYPFYLKG
jgi:hypothetical protein